MFLSSRGSSSAIDALPAPAITSANICYLRSRICCCLLSCWTLRLLLYKAAVKPATLQKGVRLNAGPSCCRQITGLECRVDACFDPCRLCVSFFFLPPSSPPWDGVALRVNSASRPHGLSVEPRVASDLGEPSGPERSDSECKSHISLLD